MSKRASDARPSNPGFDTLGTGWLTWIGLFLAAIGWVALVGGTTIADILLAKSPHPVAPSFHADLIDIAKSLITSGFGVALVGALQNGFGTLNRFFGAVLTRSAQRDTESSRPTEPIVERPAPAAAPIKRRPYRLLADGAVEVDTIVGTRVFRTMAEAREFI